MRILTRFILAASLLLPATTFAASFADVPASHPNSEAVEYVKAQGIVQGYEDGSFRPDATINRAEFVKIITLSLMGWEKMYVGDPKIPWSVCNEGIAGEAEVQAFIDAMPFSDVPESEWFAFYVCVSAKAGYVDGYPDGTFRPSAEINFVEAAKILANGFELPFETTDVWYEGYVRGIEAKNAIPTSITRFDQPITRGDMAEMIYHLKTGNKVPVPRRYDDIVRGSKTFDGCGKVSLYSKQSWFADFAAQSEKNGFDMDYSEGFSEGCLALDGSLFMAIYTGGYCEGSTFILYKPFEKNLDTAGIMWKTEGGCTHNINEFGARTGSHIALTGGFGDAGCSATYYYDYDMVTNIITKTATKEWCQDDKPQWTYYK